MNKIFKTLTSGLNPSNKKRTQEQIFAVNKDGAVIGSELYPPTERDKNIQRMWNEYAAAAEFLNIVPIKGRVKVIKKEI